MYRRLIYTIKLFIVRSLLFIYIFVYLSGLPRSFVMKLQHESSLIYLF